MTLRIPFFYSKKERIKSVRDLIERNRLYLGEPIFTLEMFDSLRLRETIDVEFSAKWSDEEKLLTDGSKKLSP